MAKKSKKQWKKASFNSRKWLNSESSSYSGSCFSFLGDINWANKKQRSAFFEIADCRSKVCIHSVSTKKKDLVDFSKKLELLAEEATAFSSFIKNMCEEKDDGLTNGN